MKPFKGRHLAPDEPALRETGAAVLACVISDRQQFDIPKLAAFLQHRDKGRNARALVDDLTLHKRRV